MIRTSTMLELVADRQTRRRIGAVAAAAMAVGASPAAAQYGTDAPLPPLPPLQGQTAAPAAGASAGANAPAPAATAAASPAAPAARASPAAPAADQSGVAGAVGSGAAVPATGTAGEIRDTGVGAPSVRVVSTERAEPVALSGDDLPFTGANIALFAVIGVGLLALGLGVRRRSGVRAAKP